MPSFVLVVFMLLLFGGFFSLVYGKCTNVPKLLAVVKLRQFCVFLSILLLVGGASIASVMYANVTERRKEIGTLMALGASRSFVTRLFLGKATMLGLAGGIGGFIVGTVVAAVLGPQLLGISVQPMPHLLAVGMAAATIVAVAASFLPARRAAGLDPCLVFNDA